MKVPPTPQPHRRDWLDVVWYATLVVVGIGAIVLDVKVGFETLGGLLF